MTQKVKDIYKECIQYDSIEAGIKAYAETYSFNIESELFHQLTKEQQALWRKEIEQAVISGGQAGVELAGDIRYKENIEAKIGETQIYIEDDGGEPPYDGKQWLDLGCLEYEIPKDKFKNWDNVEVIIRKVQKGE